MPNGDRFEVLNNIPADRLPIAVFTTAHDQDAIRALLLAAVRPYLSKRLVEQLQTAQA
jgi:CheY-like chemotaxis protein